MSDQKNKPVETLRDGNIKAAIWENTRDEKVLPSVQFRRSYRAQDGQYRDTDSFSGIDLLRLSCLAGQSYDALARLRSERQKDSPARNRQGRDQDRDRDRGR